MGVDAVFKVTEVSRCGRILSVPGRKHTHQRLPMSKVNFKGIDYSTNRDVPQYNPR